MDKKHCRGCRNDFYNYPPKECWFLTGAKLVSRIAVGHWESPPYLNKPLVKVPNCWRGEGSDRIHYIDSNKDLDSKGFWR